MQNIGDVIKKYRLKNDLTQEALGKELFVTKQAVSKCENGKTLPDIITIRKLIMPILLASILLSFFFALGGCDAIQRRIQSSTCLVVVHKNNIVMSTNDYQITGVDSVKNGSNGYSFGIDYGEVKGKIITLENEEIEFGFINTNNWHNVQINIKIDSTSESKHVYQTIIYKTDGDYIDVIESDSIMENNRVSVFKNGV